MITRTRLPDRRAHVSFSFEHEGRTYHASASRFPDGRVAEIFLSCSKAGSDVHASAAASAILASLALQYGVPAETIVSSVGGAIGRAIELAVQP